ncbi:MAG TPA: hypothetical protein G4N94_00860 [Caldilineae bacterium]|nr:hypothetical protein [Caldilineae bacterium]
MISLSGRYFRLLHNLHNHIWGDLPLSVWLLFLLAVLAILFYFGVLPGDVALAALMIALILLLLMSNWWAKRRFYVLFVALEPAAKPTSPAALKPQDKVLVRATGEFSVGGKTKRFTDLLAYYRTFETREHAIMARKTPSRFLMLGRSRPEHLGMWYIFIMPEHLRAVTPGRLYFGAVPNPALRLDYVRFTNKGKARSAVAYLSFETEKSMQQVLADLLLSSRHIEHM